MKFLYFLEHKNTVIHNYNNNWNITVKNGLREKDVVLSTKYDKLCYKTCKKRN